jgi:hypothetical protein
MDDFTVFNGVYANFFGDHKPARTTVEVARLPKDVLIEIEAIVRYVSTNTLASWPLTGVCQLEVTMRTLMVK